MVAGKARTCVREDALQKKIHHLVYAAFGDVSIWNTGRLDHLDGLKTNNDIHNLQPSTDKSDSVSRQRRFHSPIKGGGGVMRNNTSGFTGLRYDATNTRFTIKIVRDYKEVVREQFRWPQEDEEGWKKARDILMIHRRNLFNIVSEDEDREDEDGDHEDEEDEDGDLEDEEDEEDEGDEEDEEDEDGDEENEEDEEDADEVGIGSDEGGGQDGGLGGEWDRGGSEDEDGDQGLGSDEGVHQDGGSGGGGEQRRVWRLYRRGRRGESHTVLEGQTISHTSKQISWSKGYQTISRFWRLRGYSQTVWY